MSPPPTNSGLFPQDIPSSTYRSYFSMALYPLPKYLRTVPISCHSLFTLPKIAECPAHRYWLNPLMSRTMPALNGFKWIYLVSSSR
jgi:hypothetical protein